MFVFTADNIFHDRSNIRLCAIRKLCIYISAKNIGKGYAIKWLFSLQRTIITIWSSTQTTTNRLIIFVNYLSNSHLLSTVAAINQGLPETKVLQIICNTMLMLSAVRIFHPCRLKIRSFTLATICSQLCSTLGTSIFHSSEFSDLPMSRYLLNFNGFRVLRERNTRMMVCSEID